MNEAEEPPTPQSHFPLRKTDDDPSTVSHCIPITLLRGYKGNVSRYVFSSLLSLSLRCFQLFSLFYSASSIQQVLAPHDDARNPLVDRTPHREVLARDKPYLFMQCHHDCVKFPATRPFPLFASLKWARYLAGECSRGPSWSQPSPSLSVHPTAALRRPGMFRLFSRGCSVRDGMAGRGTSCLWEGQGKVREVGYEC
jgi:hypothetical protein